MPKGTLKEQILPDTPLSGGPAILSDHSDNSAPSLPYSPSMGTPQSSHCLRMTADRVPFFKRMMLRGQWHPPSASWHCFSLMMGQRCIGSLVATLQLLCGLGQMEFSEHLTRAWQGGQGKDSIFSRTFTFQDTGGPAQPKSSWEALRPHE